MGERAGGMLSVVIRCCLAARESSGHIDNGCGPCSLFVLNDKT